MADETKIESSLEEKVTLLQEKLAQLEEKYKTLQEKAHSEEPKNDSSDAPKTTEGTEENPDSQGKSTKEDEAAETASPGSVPKSVRIVISKLNAEGQREEHDEDEKPTEETKKIGYTCASILRKKIYPDRESDARIEICDPGLQNLLRRLLESNPWHTFIGEPIVMGSPFEDFVVKWDMLWEEAEKYCEDAGERQARSHLLELLQKIAQGSGDPKLDAYLQSRDSLKKQKAITFETLWTIFPPGTVVYGRLFLNHDQIFLVEDNNFTWPWEDGSRRGRSNPKTWDLRCWTYDWHAGVFDRRTVILTFEEFDGQKPISSLPYHPLKDNPNHQEIENALFNRGLLFRKYCTTPQGERLYKYNRGQAIYDKRGFQGLTTDDDDDQRSRSDTKASSKSKDAIVEGDVMVDFESYYQYGPGTSQMGYSPVRENTTECNCPDCLSNSVLAEVYKRKYDGATGRKGEDWERLQTMLCPPRVLGYVLKEKQWAQLDVMQLQEIPEKSFEDSFSKLHLNDENQTKELLFGLVKKHGMGEAESSDTGYQITDIVSEKGKGKGLVILLYGTPGVGKTSTAQTVAAATRKPLFSIGVADVGTTAKHVESHLETIFDLATTWKAVLLIDEADVFLQSRTTRTGPSTERSALVSVFLRVLEYYQGVLFLTTNQIAQFDIAVQSRIHIAIKYDELSKGQTVDIFSEFLSQYHKKKMVGDYDDLLQYAKNELWKKGFDGRQIRNIVTSSMGYALSKGEKLQRRHVAHVTGIAEDFKRDLAYQMMQWKEENTKRV